MNMPATAQDESLVSIVHGDYRLDNMMFHPSEDDYIAQYCARTGYLTPEQMKADWNFYLAYNLFRIASILQGIQCPSRQLGCGRKTPCRTGLVVCASAWGLVGGTQADNLYANKRWN